MNLIQTLGNLYLQHANPQYAEQMSRYMKNRFPFFGMQSKQREELNKKFFAENGLPAYHVVKQLAPLLFEMPQREFHYFAILAIVKHKKSWEVNDITLFETLLTTRSWWDSVDYINGSILSDFFKKFPEIMPAVTDAWSMHDNIWLKRSSIIFQLKYRKNTNLDLLTRHIEQNAASKEFFVQKAIGWALREYSKTDPVWVEHFVKTHELKPLSRREALKRIEKTNAPS